MNNTSTNENLWEEKNSTEVNPNLSNKNESEMPDTMSSTENALKKKECGNIGIVYAIRNEVTKRVYIGITTQKLHNRWKHHIKDSVIHPYPLYRAMQKYGIDKFTITPIETIYMDVNEDLILKLNVLEIKYIKHYNSYFYDTNSNGYNLTRGGGFEALSPESRKKQGKSMKLVYENNPNLARQHAEKLSKIYKENPAYGKNIADKLRQIYVDYPEKRKEIGDKQRGDKHHSFDHIIYNFRNTKTNEKFTGTRQDFYIKYNLSRSKVCLIINKQRSHHKQWILEN